MKRRMLAALLCMALVCAISANVAQADSMAPPDDYFDDLNEYRQNTYFRIDLPAFYVKWDNALWLGKFSNYCAYEEPRTTYTYYVYYAGDTYQEQVALGVAHDISFTDTRRVTDISDEMTSMLEVSPQGGWESKIIRGPFEYFYNSSRELTSIRWKHGNAVLVLSGNFEEYVGDKNTIIGKLLSVSSIDFAVAWFVIVWNLLFTPIQTALIFVAVAGIVAVIIIKVKRKKKAPVVEVAAE